MARFQKINHGKQLRYDIRFDLKIFFLQIFALKNDITFLLFFFLILRFLQLMMAKVDQFLDQLLNYNKEDIHPDVIKAIQPYLDSPEFNPDFIRAKSVAAAGN